MTESAPTTSTVIEQPPHINPTRAQMPPERDRKADTEIADTISVSLPETPEVKFEHVDGTCMSQQLHVAEGLDISGRPTLNGKVADSRSIQIALGEELHSLREEVSELKSQLASR